MLTLSGLKVEGWNVERLKVDAWKIEGCLENL
jgi:hypothetical protein